LCLFTIIKITYRKWFSREATKDKMDFNSYLCCPWCGRHWARINNTKLIYRHACRCLSAFRITRTWIYKRRLPRWLPTTITRSQYLSFDISPIITHNTLLMKWKAKFCLCYIEARVLKTLKNIPSTKRITNICMLRRGHFKLIEIIVFI
jgi:hypothetical protein